MRVRGTLLVVLAVTLLVGGCSSDEKKAEKKPTTAEIPNKPAGKTGEEFCAAVSADLITSAIDKPYRTYDAIPLNDFPVPGVVGFECQWEWINPDGDQRYLKVDALEFAGALEGALDASWKGTVDLLGAQAIPVENVGDEAVGAKLQGLVTVSARSGQSQVTVQSGSKGAASPADTGTLALIAADVLAIK